MAPQQTHYKILEYATTKRANWKKKWKIMEYSRF
ncbi:hypothetical protein PGTDC60_2224 [Porphyromonas gingivalis TDC60]|uniref:Uncharacterized protein n=1 Tax=Porphyromonas gingivalis (strain ATCC 33277 / DSM 20709 / CIP 103683 / JCM 12257 / NCTC 11834 / 2561) TaxID=431947 RepID=B2RMI6_PORG3|nr:hypothetical protein PGN_2063 [Porphyromonas gingivalis ATCC 33277]BAK26361.1 hypothetical protein PGTDC60_2224 [Porphyromonas gingivalis TDC60]